MSQTRISDGLAANGSSTAVLASGSRIMSDSLIAFQPAIEEPSNMKPSREHVFVDGGDVLRRVLPLAARIGEPQVHVLDGVLLHQVQDLGHVAVGFLLIISSLVQTPPGGAQGSRPTRLPSAAPLRRSQGGRKSVSFVGRRDSGRPVRPHPLRVRRCGCG